MKNAAFEALKKIQQKHTKVNHLKYGEFKCQEYLTSGIFSNEDISILSSLRSHTLRSIKSNFRNFYQGNTNCPLLCTPDGDTQKHLLSCNKITEKLREKETTIASHTINYEDIYSDNIYKQKAIINLVSKCIQIRNSELENMKRSTSGQSKALDPST